jgi:hypothetical protein
VTLLVAKAVSAIRPAVARPAPRYTPSPEPSLAPPAYANSPPPPPSNVARNPGGYPNTAWSAPQPTPPPNPYSGSYGGHVQEGPGQNWLLQTGPLSGADLVGHLYDNAHR